MTMKRTLQLALWVLATMVAPGAAAQDERAVKIATHYAAFAGSQDNALALVEALRHGATVKLAPGAASESLVPAVAIIEPPAGGMEWEDVEKSLAVARGVLALANISHPTAEELEAALLGGDLRHADGETLALAGVLPLRAAGISWSEVARLAAPRSR
jgi:hypothetical protein